MAYESITDQNVSAGLQVVINYVNNISDGWFSYLLLISIYFLILLGIMKYEGDFPEANVSAALLTWIISALLWFGGFLDPITVGITTAILLISFVILWLVKKSSV